ncbi:MAG: DUF3800 domain-containing protein [Sedimentisphaerales bacterium]|nr:DUF3800 domain-containing protein [Sedimentisphaerales bacterium]
MTMAYNVYCDESSHLERDRSDVMVLAAVWCRREDARSIAREIRGLKKRHGLKPSVEVKWNKVSPAKMEFYLALTDYFLRQELLAFRAVIIPDKSKLRHCDFQQDHNEWYYKMCFNLLKVILDPQATYRIYLDIKDTHSADKAKRLREILCNSIYDFDRRIIETIQPVHSHEVEQIQLADFLAGAVCYANRHLDSSAAKLEIVNHLRRETRYSLTRSTLLKETKLNLLVWQASEAET